MNHDNQKDVQLSTTSMGDAAALTTESSAIKRELTDGEIASVAGGQSITFITSPPITLGPNPPHLTPPPPLAR